MLKKLLNFTISLLIISLIFVNSTTFSKVYSSSKNEINTNDNDNYLSVMDEWKNKYKKIYNYELTKSVNDIVGGEVISKQNSFGYFSDVLSINQKNNFYIDFKIENTGLYLISFDYYSTSNSILPIEMKMKINDKVLYNEMNQIVLPTYWSYDEFTLDRYGNELSINQNQNRFWHQQNLIDESGLNNNLYFLFEEGNNRISFDVVEGSFYIGKITIKGAKESIKYNEYSSLYIDTNNNEIYKYEAENLLYKNNSSIQLKADTSSDVKPFGLVYDKINVLSSDNFNSSYDTVTYLVRVEEDGYYNISLKALIDTYKNKNCYISILINDEIPFEEAENIALSYKNKYFNYSLNDYKFYLKKNQDNKISIRINSSIVSSIYYRLKNVILEINDLGLDIKKLTGNNSDKNKDWDLERYIPNVKEKFNNCKEELNDCLNELKIINNTKKFSIEMQNINNAIKNINRILIDINKLPYKLSLLNEGSSSISYYLGLASETLLLMPITIDAIYIYSGKVKLPNARNNLLSKLWIGIKRFFISFFNNKYKEKEKSDNEVVVWVNRSMQYVNIMQLLTDSLFTQTKDIKVKFSVMPDESKLLLANAANQQPDIAININAFLPYQYALRGAIYDFTKFSDFNGFIKNFNSESLVQYIYEDGLFAIPETQNIQMMFYREDILNKLDLPIPSTWSEVTNILSELQRYGMNFYVPLSSNTSFKIFNTTLPFIFQNNGSIYTKDGLAPDLDGTETIEGISFMCDLFNIYGLPQEVGSFYNEFRSGTLPIGIADFNTYIQLSCAAPEIKGLWNVALFPGTNIDDKVNYDVTGLSQPIIMFDKSKVKNEAWEWIKWWMSSDTQILYEKTLLSSYGKEYMWNSANIEAFNNANINSEHKEIIIKEIKNIRNIPMVPGYYMMERELSNIWNKVVFQGISVRNAVDEAMVLIKREMNRKNIEFGFMDKKEMPIKACSIELDSLFKKWGLKDEQD